MLFGAVRLDALSWRDYTEAKKGETFRSGRWKGKIRKISEMEKEKKKRRWGLWGLPAALGGVFLGGTLDDVSSLNVKMEKKNGRVVEKKETSERTNGWFGGNEKILATPAAETRLSVRELRPGDILAARWEDEERNGTPGFWNHLAIVGTDGTCVVEAQKSADGVVTASINDFLERYSDVGVFRFFDSETARRASSFAEKRVAVVAVETILTPSLPASLKRKGEKREAEEVWEKRGSERSGPRYSWGASLAPILLSDAATENCVSLVRRAFWESAGVDYRWKTPDDLARWDKSGDFAKIGRF